MTVLETDRGPEAPAVRPARRGRNLRRRLSLTFVVLAVIVIAGAVLGGVALTRLDSAQHRQVDRIDPAVQTNNDLFLSLVDQETGLRGYALSRDPSFLQPYEQGRTQTDSKLATLRRQVGDDPVPMKDVRALEQNARRWQTTYAQPSLAAIRATPVGRVPQLDFAAGKELFDRIRADYQRLNEDLGTARLRARDQLRTSTIWLIALVAAALALAAAGSLLLWIALQRWILGPLTALRREVRVVADGDLEHAVTATGPPDIVELGDDAELMRRRMLSEYVEVVAARALAQESAERIEEQADELRRSNAELEQFAYIASHDLQEPLRKVTSFCQMLERRYAGQLDERGEQYIHFAVDGAKRMQNLINDLLAFSRVGRTTAGFRDVPLNESVEAAVSDLETRIADEQGRIDVGPLPTVSGDPGLLRQLFLNLLGNGLKFRGDEPPHVRIDAQRAGDWWAVTVRDNGIGIDPRYAEKVFAIFARLHPRDQYEGTGIGLALCRKIVEFHGGTIEVVTEDSGESPRRGATLRFTLPVPAEPEAAEAGGSPAGVALEGVADKDDSTQPDAHSDVPAVTGHRRTEDA